MIIRIIKYLELNELAIYQNCGVQLNHRINKTKTIKKLKTSDNEIKWERESINIKCHE